MAAADLVLRRELTTRDALRGVLARCRHSRGIAASARAVDFADPRSESVLESLSRLRIAQAGLPAPEPRVSIYDLDGNFCGRVDFYWDDFGIGECDGYGKYEQNGESLVKEKRRQTLVERTGLLVERWGWPDLDPFDPTARRLLSAFAGGNRSGRRWLARSSHPAQRTS